MKDKEYIVYRHVCPNGKIYIGVTKNVKSRWFPSKYRNGTPFKDAIIEFGWKNITHEVLFDSLGEDEALKIEDMLIIEARKNETCLNERRSGLCTQTNEYKEEEMARYKAYGKEWVKAHPEEDNARKKAWWEANKDRINARRRKKGNGGK